MVDAREQLQATRVERLAQPRLDLVGIAAGGQLDHVRILSARKSRFYDDCESMKAQAIFGLERRVEMPDQPNIVLVHGAWADGSSWSAAIERLQADGYRVTAPQFPMTRLADDVARLRQVLARQDGPTVVAGHSYGGQIITALGDDAPNVVGLVYIAAFGLDEGESIGALLGQAPPTPALAHLDIDEQGFAWLPEDDFVNHFAADVDPSKARVMHAVQQPLHASALDEVMGTPAWKSLPSWFLVADGDQAIPPDAERQFAARMGATTTEVPTNHVAMVSHPGEVVTIIETAAAAVPVAT
jgi:pimeloyl-ACP methyl ester carboxylesterase